MADPAADSAEGSAGAIAAEILRRTGGDIRLALPLGLGKPIALVNALTRAVAADPAARLSILTALTLERPDPPEGSLKHRFLAPAADRLFGRAPELDYARMLHDGMLPGNIEVAEFFMMAGQWLGVPVAQQSYIAANYTHALDMLRARRPNVVMQLLAQDGAGGDFSLSCNPDITADLLRDRAAGAQDFLLAAEIHPDLPAMMGPVATLARDQVDLLCSETPEYDLFSAPKRPVRATEHAIGLHVARTIADGGTLQIGIGAIGDAVAHALLLRQAGTSAPIQAARPFAADGFDEGGAFNTGLYGLTEMLVDGMLRLFEAGILRREVDGTAIHAAFFVDCRDFYERLRALPPAERARIQMVPVSFTNQLYGNEPTKRAARRDARFVNSTMKATLLGGLVSDVTAGGQEVSGIGGQFNFIEQAFALEGARAVITLPATRTRAGRTTSNIVWSHPHASVPRAYRDIVVTEYGIADLRGRTDAEVVAAMLRITDARFQDDLLARAQKAGKIASGFRIPADWRRNTPARVSDWLAPFELPDFPFGSDFDTTERRLLPALELLGEQRGSRIGLARLMLAGLRAPASPAQQECLARMGHERPGGLRARAEALALKGALSRGG